MKKLILNLGNGTVQRGCETVIAELIDQGDRRPLKCTAALPPAPGLSTTHQIWQRLYRTRYQNQLLRINLIPNPDDSGHSGIRYSETEFRQTCQRLCQHLNQWLDADEFQPIVRSLRTELSRGDAIQVIFETNTPQLQLLPWHLWQFFDDYPQAEIAISALDWRELPVTQTRSPHVRILVILGDSTGIDTQADRTLLSQLPHAEVVVIEEPQQADLSAHLWDPQGWDILFFAGHSETIDGVGQLYINANDRLTLPQFKHALDKAIAQGLKIAIFNSCDGIGLAQQLADVQIPYVSVMREPVPDAVAQTFLQTFLQTFADGAYFHAAIREARQRLEGLEGELPCASWLPLLWQNPTAPALTWNDLHAVLAPPAPQAPPTPSPSFPIPSPSPLTRRSASRLTWQTLVWAACFSAGLVTIGRFLGLFQFLELTAYDHLVRQQTSEVVDPRILMVEITQDDTNQYGYPLKDVQLVQLIQALNRHSPRAIGLDLHRPQSDQDGYPDLLQEFQKNPHVFMVCSYSNTDKSYAPPPVTSDEQLVNQVGFSDLPLDGDRPRSPSARSDLDVDYQAVPEELMVRRQLLSYDPNLLPALASCTTPYSLSFQLAFQFLLSEGIEPLTVNAQNNWQFGSVAFPKLPARFVGYQRLNGQSSQVMLNYRGNQPGQRVTLDQVLSQQIDPQLIQDRIILVGYTAPVARDYFVTPYGAMAGVWIHAHMVSQVISAVLDQRPLIRGLPQWQGLQWGDTVWVLGWSLGTSVLLGILNFRLRSMLGVIVVNSTLVYGVSLWGLRGGLWLPLIPSILGIVVTVGAVLIYSTQIWRRKPDSIIRPHEGTPGEENHPIQPSG